RDGGRGRGPVTTEEVHGQRYEDDHQQETADGQRRAHAGGRLDRGSRGGGQWLLTEPGAAVLAMEIGRGVRGVTRRALDRRRASWCRGRGSRRGGLVEPELLVWAVGGHGDHVAAGTARARRRRSRRCRFLEWVDECPA